jgi:glycosyltransferase involved in cell wall biosynthesis
MQPTEPRVSVLMPAYNAEQTIVEAVGSVLGQTVSDLELIVADDGSAQPTQELLREIDDRRLRIHRRPRNGGVSAARNSALQLARSPLVAQLDADDYWHPDHLEHLLPAFEDPSVGLAYANAELIGCPYADLRIAARTPGDGLPDWVGDRARQPVNDLRLLYRANPMVASAVAMRTDAVRGVKGYPEWLRVGEEYLVYIRLRRAGWRFAYVDRCTVGFRWPEPGRGVTFDRRRNAREVSKLFAMLALTSAPSMAIYSRLAREALGMAKAYAPRRARG